MDRRSAGSEIEPFNGLTPAEAERLAMLAEECAEVIQIIGKILRHGYESHHPADPMIYNRNLLEDEVGDLHAVLEMMRAAGDADFPIVSMPTGRIRKKLRYSHHQCRVR